ncbi:FkbM family methyltransferase [Microvirga sp. 0TCS3.31]
MHLESLTISYRQSVREIFVRPNTSDTEVVGQIFVDKAFDISRLKRIGELKAFLSKARQSGKRPLIIDAGANIGLTSIYFSAQCQDALIVAIEPEPSNFALLFNNVRGLQVLPIPCALAATPHTAIVVDTGEGFWAFRTKEAVSGDNSQYTVDCVTVNEIYSEHSKEAFPFIVKIDIEGEEKELFEDNIEWIQKTPIIIVELHDWMLPRQKVALPFLKAIADLDRDFVHFGENIFSIANNLDGLLPRL